MTSPTVKTIDPTNKATNVAVSKTIKVTFSETVKAGHYWIELKKSDGKAVAFTKSINGNVLTINPTSNLTPGTKYTLIIHTGSLTDLNGNNVSLTTSTFTTDGTAPTVKSIDPVNKAANIPINKTIKVTFNESIKAGTNYIELKDSKGTAVPFTKSINGNVLTITPTNELVNATTYELILHTGCVTDLAGNKVALYRSSFTTDRTAPTVTTIDPANKVSNIAINKLIKVTFSESIKEGTNYIEFKDGQGKAVSFTKSINNNVLTIAPTGGLFNATTYELILHTGCVTDLSGNKVALRSSSFTTDGTTPTVTTIDPPNKASNIPISRIIKVTFSESIKAGSNYIELKDSNGKAVPFTKSINGNVLTIKPASLVNATTYELILHTGCVTDLSNNKLALYRSSFTTDRTAPTVTTIYPSNNTEHVAVNKIIKVTFSEPIKKGTGWIELICGGKTVPINISISSNVLTIKPISNLTTRNMYTLIIHTGSVTDLSGNNMSLYTSMFTTVSSSSKVIGYWMFSAEAKQLTTAKAQALKSKGITDIYVCTRDVNGNYHLSELQNAITLLHKQVIKVHAWIICFKNDEGWVNPLSSTYQSSLISQIKSITTNYNVDGIHLDYVRYPGTAYNYQNASQIIAEFVSKVDNVIGDKILSCAVMAEGSINDDYYGQDYSLISKYCNYLCPMAYKGNYEQSTSWITSTISYIVQRSSCPIYAGLTTYCGDDNLRALSASEMQTDVNSAKKGGASGIVLFKYNFGYTGSIIF